MSTRAARRTGRRRSRGRAGRRRSRSRAGRGTAACRAGRPIARCRAGGNRSGGRAGGCSSRRRPARNGAGRRPARDGAASRTAADNSGGRSKAADRTGRFRDKRRRNQATVHREHLTARYSHDAAIRAGDGAVGRDARAIPKHQIAIERNLLPVANDEDASLENKSLLSRHRRCGARCGSGRGRKRRTRYRGGYRRCRRRRLCGRRGRRRSLVLRESDRRGSNRAEKKNRFEGWKRFHVMVRSVTNSEAAFRTIACAMGKRFGDHSSFCLRC